MSQNGNLPSRLRAVERELGLPTADLTERERAVLTALQALGAETEEERIALRAMCARVTVEELATWRAGPGASWLDVVRDATGTYAALCRLGRLREPGDDGPTDEADH